MATRPAYQLVFFNNTTSVTTAALTTGVTTAAVVDGTVWTTNSTLSPTRCTYATISDGAQAEEVIRITGYSGNNLTIVRAEDGTSQPASWPIGSIIDARLTQGILKYLDAMGYGDEDEQLNIGKNNNLDQTADAAVAIGSDIVIGAADYHAVAIGHGVNISGGAGDDKQIAIGKFMATAADNTVTIGAGGGTGTTGVNDGDNTILIGHFSENSAGQTDGVCIGYSAGLDSSGSGSVVIGALASALGSNIEDAVIIGYNAVASDSRSITVGGDTLNAGFGSVLIGWFSTVDANSDDVFAAGSNVNVVTSDNAVAIGVNNDITNSADAISIGQQSTLSAAATSVALGPNNDLTTSANTVVIGGSHTLTGVADAVMVGVSGSVGNSGVSIGRSTNAAADAVAIGWGANALAQYSTAIGEAAETYAEGTHHAFGPDCVQRDAGWFYHQTEPIQQHAGTTTIMAPQCDLGPGVVWSATTYNDGEVVIPASPALTEQFFLVIGTGAGTTYDTAYNVTNSLAETGSEPATWVVAAQGDRTATKVDADSSWVYVDPQVGIDIAVDKVGWNGGGQVMFYPTRAGFLCQSYVAMTANPFVSIGNAGDPQEYVANTQLTGIAASDQMQWFDIDNPVGATNIVFTLETKGTVSGRCQGRFFVEGYYVQKMG
jgi:hypothetical protein